MTMLVAEIVGSEDLLRCREKVVGLDVESINLDTKSANDAL